MKRMVEDLKRRVEAAKQALEQLNVLIEIAKDAGEDVTDMELERDALAEKIERWESAINKQLSKLS